jgi:anti-sigma-K factor RskA
MIDEKKEEDASLYVLGLLEGQEAADMAEEMRNDALLRGFVDELQATAASLAYAAPPQKLPEHLRTTLLVRLHEERTNAANAAASPRKWNFIPWALAASLAALATVLAFERTNLRRELSDLRSQDALATLRVAALSSQLQGAKALGAIAWNGETQRGLVMLEKMPPLEQNQDYQLWVIDPKKPQPVSGGIVHVDNEGNARLTFTVEVPITNADKFAISRERYGGAPTPEGPIVMLSN